MLGHEMPAASVPAMARERAGCEVLHQDFLHLDLPAALAAAGFHQVRRVPCDPRHRVLVATRP